MHALTATLVRRNKFNTGIIKFKNIGNDLISAYAKDAVGLLDITLQDSSTDLLIDPGLIQYNYSIIHQLVTTWLESEVSYDQQRHNKVADIITWS